VCVSVQGVGFRVVLSIHHARSPSVHKKKENLRKLGVGQALVHFDFRHDELISGERERACE